MVFLLYFQIIIIIISRYLTRVPHIAGTPEDRNGAEYLRDKWLEYGVDKADLKPYKVLLQYPPDPEDTENANKVTHSILLFFSPV